MFLFFLRKYVSKLENINLCVPSCLLNQVLWFNKFIQINRKPVLYKKFYSNNINFLMQLVDRIGVFKN